VQGSPNVRVDPGIRADRGSGKSRLTPGDPAPGVAYFLPTATARRLRPRRRRRFSTSRPRRVRIRARNPCLFVRFRLRGRYVGFIGNPFGSYFDQDLACVAKTLMIGTAAPLVNQAQP
jgi:hypothetical protein